MTERDLKSRTREGFERMFNSGDLEYVDVAVAVAAIDHQEPDGTDMGAHLKQVIATLRTAFPDLHFELHEMLCEDDVVAQHLVELEVQIREGGAQRRDDLLEVRSHVGAIRLLMVDRGDGDGDVDVLEIAAVEHALEAFAGPALEIAL